MSLDVGDTFQFRKHDSGLTNKTFSLGENVGNFQKVIVPLNKNIWRVSKNICSTYLLSRCRLREEELRLEGAAECEHCTQLLSPLMARLGRI